MSNFEIISYWFFQLFYLKFSKHKHLKHERKIIGVTERVVDEKEPLKSIKNSNSGYGGTPSILLRYKENSEESNCIRIHSRSLR